MMRNMLRGIISNFTDPPRMPDDNEQQPLRLDLGCGRRPKEGFVGVDSLDFGQEYVLDLRVTPWPWQNDTVDQVRSSHFVEHLTGSERISFFNELYRVMKPGAEAEIITPNWSHASAYGDPTHQWPPMSPWYAFYLNKAWRDKESPHVGYACDFDNRITVSWDKEFNDSFNSKSLEERQLALQHYVNACRELIVVLTKRPYSA